MLGANQSDERIAEEKRILPVIEAPFKLVKVGIQVFLAHFVIGTNDTPLEQRPRILNAVCVDSTPRPLFNLVIHTLMLVRLFERYVGGVLVRENLRIYAHPVPDTSH